VRLLVAPCEFPLPLPCAVPALPLALLFTLSGREGGTVVLVDSTALGSRLEPLGLLLCSARFWAEPFIGERGRCCGEGPMLAT
jgi:hypothetical protein